MNNVDGDIRWKCSDSKILPKRVFELDFRIRNIRSEHERLTDWMNFLFNDPTQMIHGYRIAYICKEKQQCGHLQVNLPWMEHLVIAMRQYLEYNLLFISINFIWKTSLASCLKTWKTLYFSIGFQQVYAISRYFDSWCSTDRPKKTSTTIEPCFGLHRSDGPTVSHFPGWSSPKRSWNRENGRLESTVENPLKNRYRDTEWWLFMGSLFIIKILSVFIITFLGPFLGPSCGFFWRKGVAVAWGGVPWDVQSNFEEKLYTSYL